MNYDFKGIIDFCKGKLGDYICEKCVINSITRNDFDDIFTIESILYLRNIKTGDKNSFKVIYGIDRNYIEFINEQTYVENITQTQKQMSSGPIESYVKFKISSTVYFIPIDKEEQPNDGNN